MARRYTQHDARRDLGLDPENPPLEADLDPPEADIPPHESDLGEAIETLGGLVSAAGGEGDAALDTVKDALSRRRAVVKAWDAWQNDPDDEDWKTYYALRDAIDALRGGRD